MNLIEASRCRSVPCKFPTLPGPEHINLDVLDKIIDNTVSKSTHPIAGQVPENERHLSTFVPFGCLDLSFAIFCGPFDEEISFPDWEEKRPEFLPPQACSPRLQSIDRAQFAMAQGVSERSRISTPLGLEKTNSSGLGD